MFALFTTYFGDSGVNGSDKLVGLAKGKKENDYGIFKHSITCTKKLSFVFVMETPISQLGLGSDCSIAISVYFG